MLKTQAIVLSAALYSETSLLVRLLTRDLGVVRALAKGARRPKSRLAGLLEPFYRIETILALKDPDSLGNLGETRLLDASPCLRADLPRLAYAALGVEVLGRLAEVSPHDPFFYDEACRFLDALTAAPGAGSVTIALLLRLLHHGGFPPQLAEAWTPSTLPATLAYDFETGTFVVPGPTTPLRAMRLPGRAVAGAHPALLAAPPLGDPFRVAAGDGPPLIRWLIRLWEDHLNARLRSAEFLEKMVLDVSESR